MDQMFHQRHLVALRTRVISFPSLVAVVISCSEVSPVGVSFVENGGMSKPKMRSDFIGGAVGPLGSSTAVTAVITSLTGRAAISVIPSMSFSGLFGGILFVSLSRRTRSRELIAHLSGAFSYIGVSFTS